MSSINISAETKGSLLALLSGLLYGLVGFFGIKLLNLGTSIPNMQFWRFLVSALTMVVIIIYQRKSFKEDRNAVLKTFLMGGLFYGVAAGVYFIACEYIGTGPAMVIFFCYPAFVIILNAIIYKQRIPRIYYAALSLIVIGMLFLVDIGEFTADIIGIAVAVFSGLCYAGYIVSCKKIKISPEISTLVVSLGCAFSCMVYSLGDHGISLPHGYKEWIYLIGFGVLTTALPMLLFLEALKKISAEKASILSVSEPIFVVILGVFILDEVINLPKVIGIVIILSGAVITLFAHTIKEHTLYIRFAKKVSQWRSALAST